MENISIDTRVSGIEIIRVGDGAKDERVVITTSYQEGSVRSSISFRVSIARASQFFVGQKINITISW